MTDVQDSIVVVTTRDDGSIDRYGRELAKRLAVPRLEVDTAGTSMELIDARCGPWTLLRRPARDAALVRSLRAAPGVPHLTHHHMARYGPRTGRPFLVTVHDLIRYSDLTAGTGWISHPSRRDAAGLRQDAQAVRRAAHVIAVSEFTRRDLEEMLGLPTDRITVVHEGVDTGRFRPGGARPIADPYVLYVGSEQPRKNLPLLLQAFALVKRDPELRTLRLLKVGKPGQGHDFRSLTLRAIRELGLEREVILAGYVPDEELPAYYTHAECFVLPSLQEGFGLPPLEAMACGCPVVVSAAGSLPEVAGDAGVVVDATSVDAVARAMYDILTDSRLRAELRDRGLRRAAGLSWEKAAERTARVYDAVLARQQPVG